MNLVIDTNIFISELIKREGWIRELAINPGFDIIFPEYEFREIYKHKEELLRKSGYSEIEFIQAISALLRHMKIAIYFEICCYYSEAFEIIGKIDTDDVIFIATALAFNCPIWSDDKHFKKQDKIRVFTTKEMQDLI